MGLVYLSPVLLVIARVLGLVLVQVYQRVSLVKTAFNVSATALGATTAALIVVSSRSRPGCPSDWFILTVAVAASRRSP